MKRQKRHTVCMRLGLGATRTGCSCGPSRPEGPEAKQAQARRQVYKEAAACCKRAAIFVFIFYRNYTDMLLNCGVGEDSRESLGLQGDPASPF